MGFLAGIKRIFGVGKKPSPTLPTAVKVTNGGIYTNEDALGISSVYRSISAIGNAVGGMSLRCYRVGSRGYVEDDTTSLGRLLMVAPNEHQTMAEFMSQLISDVHIFGNALVLINRYGGEVRSLKLADPTFVSVTTSGYMVCNTYYSRDRCIHIRNVYVDRQTGLGISTLKHAYDTLTLSKTADSETEGIISGGGRARGVFTSDDSGIGFGAGATANQKIEVEQIEKELESGKTLAFVPGNLKFIQFAMNPVDTQLQEVRRMSIIDICRFFSVHPDKLYAGQTSNYKASMEAQSNFLKDSVFPWCRRISQAFTQTLVEKPLWGKFFIDFDYKEALLGDVDGQVNLLTKLYNVGGVTINEVRDVLRFERIPEGDIPVNQRPQSLQLLEQDKATQEGQTSTQGKENGTGGDDTQEGGETQA